MPWISPLALQFIMFGFFISLFAFTRVCQDKEEHQELKEILVQM